jgi:hypothetical protein
MFSKEELWEMRSSWIHPNGTIQIVPQEGHDDNLPPFCKTIENAENSCVKLSCCWGYDAEISEIYLPRKLTTYQAQNLVKINESIKKEYNQEKNIKINLWHNGLGWKEIFECV